jgi:cytochrome c-type biogenesis protein CcmH
MLSLMGALFFAVVSGAAPAQAPPRLTPEQKAIARRLDGMFMAPCCFANTLAEHHSPVAEELRQEIRIMLAGGATETQIADAFVAKYGERILAAPRAQGFNLLAYVLPAAVIVAGLVVIAVVMRRRGPRGPSAVSPSEIPDQIKARFEAELARFDE